MLFTIATPFIAMGDMIFSFWWFSSTSPSQAEAPTLSPGFTNGTKCHFLSLSSG